MYSTEISYQQPKAIRKMQEEKLRELLHYLQQFSPFYKDLFWQNDIDIKTIKTLDHLSRIPTTIKEHLQLRNDDFLCVPRDQVIEYSSTSGTLGSPVTVALTESDLERLAYNEYASFTSAGGSSADIYQLMLTLDRQFMAGMAYYSGIRKLGAGIIRLGPGVPSLQWETILRLKPTAIVAAAGSRVVSRLMLSRGPPGAALRRRPGDAAPRGSYRLEGQIASVGAAVTGPLAQRDSCAQRSRHKCRSTRPSGRSLSSGGSSTAAQRGTPSPLPCLP